MESINQRLHLPPDYEVDKHPFNGMYRFSTLPQLTDRGKKPCIHYYVDDFFTVHYGKWGYINEQGKIVIEPKYDYLVPFGWIGTDQEDYAIAAIVDRNNQLKCGLIDTKGNEVLPFIYPQLHNMWIGDDALAFSRDDEKYGLMDFAGNIIIEPAFVDIMGYDRKHRLIIFGERDEPFDPPRGLYSIDKKQEVLPMNYLDINFDDDCIICERYDDNNYEIHKYEEFI